MDLSTKKFGAKVFLDASKGKNNDWRILYQPIELLQRRQDENTTAVGQEQSLFHQDNTMVLTCLLAVAKFHESDYWRRASSEERHMVS